MSVLTLAKTDYADRLAARHSTLQRIDQTSVPWEEGFVPLTIRRGSNYAKVQTDRFHDVLIGARKRVREEQIKQLLTVKPEWDLLWRTPLGAPKSMQQVVESEMRVVLLGQAGAGKTTALRSLAVKRPKLAQPVPGSDDDRVLVFLVDLANIPNLGEASLPQVLSQDAQDQLSLSLDAQDFQDVLIRGEAVVCVDGLDDLPEQAGKAQATRQIEAWVREFPNCRYVVAARSNVYEPGLDKDDFVHYALTPWYPAFIAELERAWKEGLAGWTATDPDRPYYTQQGRLWQHLALEMSIRDRRSASEDQAQEWLTEAVRRDRQLRIGRRRVAGEVNALLEEGPPQLVFVRSDKGTLSFVPPVLQEVLAARALATLCAEQGVRAAWEQMQGRVQTVSWRETIKLVLRFVLQEQPELGMELVGLLLEADAETSWEPVLHRRLLIAASALEGLPGGQYPQVSARVVDGLMAWLTDGSAVGRAESVRALLGLAGDTYAGEKVLAALTDSGLDEWSREAAALLLGRLGEGQGAETVAALEARIEDESEGARVQQAAIIALGALGSSGALEEDTEAALVEWLSERACNADLSIDARVAVVEALGLIVAQTARAEITQLLLALARGENEDERVPYSVRTAAARGIRPLISTGENEGLVEEMWRVARDPEVDDGVRTLFAETLGLLGQAEEAAEVLLELTTAPKVYAPGHRAAIEALGRLGYGSDEVVAKMVEIATTKDRKTKDFERLAAAQALDGLGQLELSLQHTLMLIADKSLYRSTRNEALRYLGSQGATGNEALDAAAIAVLQVWMNEENTTEDVRENAIQTLCWLHAGQDEIIRDMIGIIQNRSTYPRVRRYAAAMLDRLPIAEKAMVVEALSPTFYDPEEKSDLLRVPIARLLFLWGEDEHALAYLRAAAEQSYMAQVRYNASMVLLEIGEADLAYIELLKLAQNPDIADPIRRDSLRALGLWAVGREDIAEAVAEVAQNAALESNVREAAFVSLNSIEAA
jgi:hypothetical protein